MRWPALVALGVPAVLAAAAIGGATGGGGPRDPVVVTVEARGERTATGYLAADGRVVTVAHALGDGPVVVRGADGAARPATVVRRDERLDLAVLAVGGLPDDAPVVARAPLGARGPAYAVVLRDGAHAPATVVRRIDARVRSGDGGGVARRDALELRTTITAGDSGAPLLGPDGRVAGVVFARSRERPGIAYAVAASELDALLP